LPRGLFTELIHECKGKGSSSDLLGSLFRQMASTTPAKAGRFVNVPYFNGGLFLVVEPVELTGMEVTLLAEATEFNWSRVNPAIFGTLFEGSMDQEERHAFGAHFTSEADIQKVVLPTIVRPWRERLVAAKSVIDVTPGDGRQRDRDSDQLPRLHPKVRLGSGARVGSVCRA
jgi:hypothetical protein